MSDTRKLPERPRCELCRFYEGQQCHRHAPALQESPSTFPRWPWVQSWDWCGDYEAKPPKQEGE